MAPWYFRIFGRSAAGSILFVTIAVVCLERGWSQDLGWPREKTVNGARLVYYQPQVDEWNDFKLLDLRMAITITPASGKTQPGVVTAEMQTDVNVDAHTVLLSHPLITGTYFPSLDPASSAKMAQLVGSFLPPTAMLTISLDRLVASANKPKPKTVAVVRNDPPAIYFSFKPAILLQLNGDPVKVPVANSQLDFVVNANWPLFLDKSTSAYYLFNGAAWMISANPMTGWSPTPMLSPEMAKVAADPNWKDLKAYIPPPPGSAGNAPAVFASTTPAEVVVFSGMPKFAPIPGTQLVYATNTGSDVFKYTPTGTFYYLTSGRWFSSPTALGPWSFASNHLPADFANIPLESPPGRVLASVPGTPEAEDAVLLAEIPVTAQVDSAKAAAEAKVVYSGSPQFVPIQGTTLAYATNTPNRVIQVGSLYYLCFQGVWFMSTTPQGPWQTAPTVPPEIYTIPPSSPVYNVTYVTQTTVNGVIVASYTPGYYGVYVTPVGGAVVVATGTGYIYPPVVVVGVGLYPIYYPYPMTYGVATFYSPYSGAYGVAHSAYGPYGSATWGAAYNPSTGTYARGASVSNAYGTQKVAQAYNPYTGNYGATHQGSNAYGSWGNSVVSNGNNTVYTQHQTNANGTVATAQSTAGGKAAGVSTANGNTAAGKTANGDMYAGHDGNVYKNTGSGWETYNNGSWAPVQKPTGNTATTAGETNQQKLQSNPNYASAQQKAQSNPNYASAQQKAQSNPNYSADQQKAKSYGQQTTNNGAYSRPSGSQSTSDLNQQAQARQRGAQQSQRYSQTQRGAGTRSYGGGNRR
jgi:hypothetical protein